MNLTKKEVKQTGVAYAIPFKRPVKSNIEVKISDRMGHCCLMKQLIRNFINYFIRRFGASSIIIRMENFVKYQSWLAIN